MGISSPHTFHQLLILEYLISFSLRWGEMVSRFVQFHFHIPSEGEYYLIHLLAISISPSLIFLFCSFIHFFLGDCLSFSD